MNRQAAIITEGGIRQRQVSVIGALDTKGDQIAHIIRFIERKGHKPIIIDVGILGKPTCPVTITRQEVAKSAGTTSEKLIDLKDENKAMNKLAEGACIIVKDLHEKGELDGILAAGGSMVTSLALKVMNVLPLTLPKIILSTVAYSPSVDPDYLGNGVVMMQWIGGLWGINDLVKRTLDQAAAYVTAGSEVYDRGPVSQKKMLAISSLGMSAATYLAHLKPAFEKKGYEIAAFHPTGMNTRTMERAIEEGLMDAILDLRIGTELLSAVSGSLFRSTQTRLEAAIKKGIPLVTSPAGMEAIIWAPYKKIPRKFANRISFKHNPLLWVFASTLDEKVKVANLMVKKLNIGSGPTAVVIALQFSPHQVKYGIRDVEGLNAFREILRKKLKPHIKVIEVDATYDDKEFGDEVIRILEEML